VLKPAPSRTKPRITAFILALVLIAAAACGGGSSSSSSSGGGGNTTGGADNAKPQEGGSIVYAQEAEDAGGLCLPEAQLDISGINYARTIYDTLTAPDENGKFVPYLASKVEANADFTQWTITLGRTPQIMFHDGTPLTATVVKNNLDAYRGKYPGRSPILFSLVFGPYITDVTADDTAQTVTVTVDGNPNEAGPQGWPAFDSYLWSSARLGMMAQAQLDAGADCAKNLIGTGPFKLKEWVVNDHFTAVKNANYWQTGFGPSNVELHRLSAALDLGDVTQVIDSAPRVTVEHLPVERQVTHLIDLARALSLVAKDDDALQTLLSAEQKSPGIVRHSVVVREVVRSMYRRAPATAGKKSSPLLALAERCRAVG
jgi:ABC-type transport system substrate-binding protein